MGETSSDDELSSGFTTVPEEDREETPPDAPISSDVPVLKRTTAIRAFNFEEFAKRMCSKEPTEYIGAAVLVGSSVSSLHSVPSFQANGHASLKRKVSSNVTRSGKRCRTTSEGGSPNGLPFVTNVSSKSLQSLKLDKEVPELTHMAQEFPQA